ncbi:MAG: DUF1338 domain-containing protein [Lentisphaeraceae bacterium]|nr:DUF1338 domain-containing protein [Lentisphaeraceae bacterium]
MMMTLDDLFEKLWQEYSTVNTQAKTIHSILKGRGERIVNDHIALRTFASDKVGIAVLSKAFVDFGYEVKGHYEFKQKKLRALHFEKNGYPRVFISELKLEEFDADFQARINTLIDCLSVEKCKSQNFSCSGRPWPMISYKLYEELREKSEYAAWLAVFGFVVNHFTISVNSLKTFPALTSLNTFLKNEGFVLSSAGGEIKGGETELLAQSSTLAAEVDVKFSDGIHEVPCCYYEFAERFPMLNGELFSGFIAASADKIFESTDRQ